MPQEIRVDKGQAAISASDDRVVIRSSKTKLILIVVGALLFVFCLLQRVFEVRRS